MPAIQKASGTVLHRGKKDKDAREAEYKFTKALFQLGANKLLEAVKEGKVLLYAKDLKDIHAIKSQVAFDDMEESGMYFVACNACLFSKSCSLFSAGAECGFNLNAGEITNSRDIMDVLVKLLRIESDRIQRSLLIEKIDGGVDREVSQEMMMYFEMVQKLKNIMAQEESIEIRVKGKGAISKIFGDVIKKSPGARGDYEEDDAGDESEEDSYDAEEAEFTPIDDQSDGKQLPLI